MHALLHDKQRHAEPGEEQVRAVSWVMRLTRHSPHTALLPLITEAGGESKHMEHLRSH